MPTIGLKHIIYILLVTFSLNPTLRAQDEEKEKPAPGKIELKQAKSLEGSTVQGQHIRKLKGNVIFKQGATMLYCDSAFQYTKSNEIDAFGHVRIKQGDSLNVTGNTLHYNGNTKLAEIVGDVHLVNKKTRVQTEQLNYQTDTRTAYYFTGATIKDGNNTLVSKQGSYNASTEFFGFKDDVKLTNPQYTIDCDTLNYSSRSKIAYFHGPTDIKSKSGTLFAMDGEYNTITGESYFSRSAAIENDDYKLIGDKLHYDDAHKTGHAEGNIELTLKGQHIIIYGDKGFYDEGTGLSKTHGDVLLKYAMNEDTMYLKADTMVSLQKDNDLKRIDAFPNVRIYREGLSGLCDSLSYLVSDSSIQFYAQPILWSGGSQLTGEEIKILLDSNEIDKMLVDRNAFMVSEDSITNFNQIKGKNMVAHFSMGDLDVLDVLGNGQSLYFALEGDTALQGLNTTFCSTMKILMDSSKVHDIKFLSDPDAHFIPPNKIEAPDRKLPGFIWRINEQPQFEEFLYRKIKPSNVAPELNSSTKTLPINEVDKDTSNKKMESESGSSSSSDDKVEPLETTEDVVNPNP